MNYVTRRHKRVLISALIALAAVAGAVDPGRAQILTQPRKPAPPPAPVVRAAPAAPSVATPAPEAPAVAEITGFRSARFGMTEPDVRRAIENDFRTRPDEIRSEENKAEQTQVAMYGARRAPRWRYSQHLLCVRLQVKEANSGRLSWSKATDEKMTPEQLFSNANILRTHFLEAGYKPDTISTNMPVNGGVLMFRGSDAHERTTVMILQGTFSQGENNQRVLTPTALLLFYIADAKNPDVYRLPEGSF